MANSTARFGFLPYGSSNQKGFGGTTAYYIPASVSTAVAIGDVVKRTVGTNASAIAGIPAGVLPNCAPISSDTSTAITGVVVGIMPVDPFASKAAQGAASTARVVYVMDDVNATFRVCADTGVTVNVGGNCGIDYAACSNGISQLCIAASNTTATLPFHVVGVNTTPRGDTEFIVKINASTEMTGATGINS